MPEQLSLETAKRLVRLQLRIADAKELVSQAEELLQHSEHLTFDSSLELLERLRIQEPENDSIRNRCGMELARKMMPNANG